MNRAMEGFEMSRADSSILWREIEAGELVLTLERSAKYALEKQAARLIRERPNRFTWFLIGAISLNLFYGMIGLLI